MGAQVKRHLFSHAAGVGHALGPCAGIGAAGVDQHGVDALGVEVQQLAVVDHGRGRERVLREHTRRPAWNPAGDQRQIRRAVLLDPRGDPRRVEAGVR